MSDVLLLAMMSLAAYRLTWLVTRDSFPPVRRAREAIVTQHRRTARVVRVDDSGHADERGGWTETRGPWEWAADLVTCYWCVSVWASGGVTFLTWLVVDDMPLPLLWFGATAALSALIASLVNLMESGD